MSTTYWCEHAWLGGATAEHGVSIEIEGATIASVTPTQAPPAGSQRLPGLTLPGFANAHSHAFHRALRGRSHGVELGADNFWMWRRHMYQLAEALDPDRYRALARGVYAEMAMAGITCVGEFHYLHHGPHGVPYDDPTAMSAALVSAADEAGIRITVLDTAYLRGGIASAAQAEAALEGVQLRFGDGSWVRWAERADATARSARSPTARFGHAVHSVRAVPPDAIAAIAAHSLERDAVLHAHVSEQPAENEQCLAAYGRTPVQLLADCGVLGERFTAVHATHVTDADVAALGASRCGVCLCPTTERDLADGIGPARRLADAGAALSLGSDSHAVIDLLEEARAVELDERLTSGRRGQHTGAALLTAATAAGHAALGWPEAGRIVAGAPADLVTVRLDSVRTAGADPDLLLDTAVFAATAADVDRVIVGGRTIVADGRHVSIDAAAELAASIADLTGRASR